MASKPISILLIAVSLNILSCSANVSSSTPPPPSVPVTSPPAPEKDQTKNHLASIGDSVEYLSTGNGSSETEIFTNQSYDKIKNVWNVLHTIQGAQPKSEMLQADTSWSTLTAQNFIAKCTENKGSLQTITVKAGTFQTCMVDDGKQKTWYGEVPVAGNIRVQDDKSDFTMELVNYIWGDTTVQPPAPAAPQAGFTPVSGVSFGGQDMGWSDPSGLIWGLNIPDPNDELGDPLEFSYKDALAYCASHGGRLPTDKDYTNLAQYMGKGSPEGYVPQAFAKDDVKISYYFWLQMPQGPGIFDVRFGDIAPGIGGDAVVYLHCVSK